MTTEKTSALKDLAKKAPISPLEQWKAAVFKEENLALMSRALNGTAYSAERFAHTAYMVVARNSTIQANLGDPEPKRLALYKQKLWLGVYAAAECGLSLQAHMQQMHLVPYAQEIQPIIGYKGFTFLISKAGGGLMGPPVLVWQRDVDEGRFRYREGTRERCELDPVVKNPELPRGQLRYVFATYTTPGGVTKFKCMEREAFLERRERSQSWKFFKQGKRKSSPWNIEIIPAGLPNAGSEGGDWPAMCAKTVIRDFAKVLPQSTDHWGQRAATAEAVDNVAEYGEGELSEVLETTITMGIEETANQKLNRALGDEDAQVEG